MANTSKIKKPMIFSGIIILVMGFVFLLQSQGTLGPESSFMYANPEWYTNGKAIMLVGGGLCVAAMFIQSNVKRSDK